MHKEAHRKDTATPIGHDRALYIIIKKKWRRRCLEELKIVRLWKDRAGERVSDPRIIGINVLRNWFGKSLIVPT